VQIALPFNRRIVVDSPGGVPSRRLRRRRWAWLAAAPVLAIAAVVTWWLAGAREGDGPADGRPLALTSTPAGAQVLVDGQPRGRTPATVRVEPGRHEVVLLHPDAVDTRLDVAVPPEGAAVGTVLWRREPEARHVRPTFPGATVVGGTFLKDGRLALTVALPPGDERQAWLLDAVSGGLQRVGPPDARAGLAVASDGTRVAYFARGTGTGAVRSNRFDELWVAGSHRPYGARLWRVTDPDQHLADAAWSPDGAHLLVATTSRTLGASVRTRLLWIAASGGDPRELVELPSEVVPGSYAWSPDGQRAAFLTRSGMLTALCLVAADGDFRYLGDISRDDASPLPLPPVAWSADGRRLLYAAPVQDRSSSGGWLWGSRPTTGIFALDLDRPVGERLGSAEGQSPVWRADGTILTLARPKSDGKLVLRSVDPSGASRDLGPLPVGGAAYAVRWDAAHAQALVAVRASASLGASRPEYWLLRFAAEDAR
jgi:hypothetical protein